MSICTRCGEVLTETPGLSFCPKCMDCFIPSGMISPDVEEEETFARIRSYLNEDQEPGRLLIWEREHGTGCTTALHALATHQLLPHALPDFTAFYFDANRPPYRIMDDFRSFLRGAVRVYAPRYEEPDAEPATACTRMLADLSEQVLLRSARKHLLIFIALPEHLPEDFLRELPRGRSLPRRTGLFLVCSKGQGTSLNQIIPRAQSLPPILRNSELHYRAIRQMMTDTFCPTFRHRLAGGGRAVEQGIASAGGDYHRAHLLQVLYEEAHAFSPQELPAAADVWQFALKHYEHEWGGYRFHAALRIAVMLVVWGIPLPPMILPGLCDTSTDALADALRIPELLRLDRQEDTVVVSISCPEAVNALRTYVPEAFREAAERLVALAEGDAPLRLPHGGLCRFYSGAPEALARFGDDALLKRFLKPEITARMHRRMCDALATESISPAEVDEVWTARIWFARVHTYLPLRAEACQYRLQLHRSQNLPASEAADLTELLDAVQPIFQRRAEGRLQLARFYAQRADCFVRACRARAALEDFDRAVRFASQLPDDPDPAVLEELAELLYARGEFELQHRLHEQALDDFDQVIRILDQIDTADSALPERVLMARSKTYARLQKVQAALQDLDRLCGLLPPERTPLRCEAYALQGELFDEAGEPLKAAAAYSRVVEHYRALVPDAPQYLPELAEAYGARATSYERNGNTDCAYADRCEAIEMLTSEETPSDLPPEFLATAYLKRAQLLGHLERHAEAIADCTAGIALLEPKVTSSAKELVALCLALYKERDRLYTIMDCPTGATEDRRRMMQLRILLR